MTKDNQRIKAKLSVLQAFFAFHKQSSLGIIAARKEFTHLYNNKCIPIDDRIRDIVPHVSQQSLINWATICKADVRRLAGDYGNRKGTSKIESQPPMHQLLIETITSYPHMSAADLRLQIMDNINSETTDIPSVRSIQRWLRRRQSKNQPDNSDILIRQF